MNENNVFTVAIDCAMNNLLKISESLCRQLMDKIMQGFIFNECSTHHDFCTVTPPKYFFQGIDAIVIYFTFTFSPSNEFLTILLT